MTAFSRSDDRKVLDLYLEAGRQSLSQDDERVFRLSQDIHHSQKSVHMRMCNYQWFDPERIGGLDGGSWQSWEIWRERMNSGVNMPRRGYHRYSRCDNIMILDLYFEAGRQPLPERHLRILELSGIIGTSPKSVHRRMATYQWLDPERIGGLDTETRLTREVWNKFASDEQCLREASANCKREAKRSDTNSICSLRERR